MHKDVPLTLHAALISLHAAGRVWSGTSHSTSNRATRQLLVCELFRAFIQHVLEIYNNILRSGLSPVVKTAPSKIAVSLQHPGHCNPSVLRICCELRCHTMVDNRQQRHNCIMRPCKVFSSNTGSACRISNIVGRRAHHSSIACTSTQKQIA